MHLLRLRTRIDSLSLGNKKNTASKLSDSFYHQLFFRDKIFILGSMRIWLFIFSLMILTGCKNGQRERTRSSSDTAVYYPFAPIYSNEFDPGKPEYARMVLQVWRQYETGSMKPEWKSFADTIRLILPDKILHGHKDSILQLYQQRRDRYINMQCFISSWLPVHFTDEGDDVVYVWGIYDGTFANGDRDYAMVHEIWRFNKDGKISELEQFRTHPH